MGMGKLPFVWSAVGTLSIALAYIFHTKCSLKRTMHSHRTDTTGMIIAVTPRQHEVSLIITTVVLLVKSVLSESSDIFSHRILELKRILPYIQCHISFIWYTIFGQSYIVSKPETKLYILYSVIVLNFASIFHMFVLSHIEWQLRLAAITHWPLTVQVIRNLSHTEISQNCICT